MFSTEVRPILAQAGAPGAGGLSTTPSAPGARAPLLNAAGGAPPDWRWLYRAGGAAALITVLLIPVAILSHMLWPPPPWAPGAAGEWFAYIQANRLAGFLNLDLAMAVGLVLSVPLYLALYAALGRTSRSGAVIATATALLGTLLHLLSNTAVEMVAFSDVHAAAATDAQRAVYLAAGEAALSAYYGAVFQVSYVLGYAAYVAIGALMLRSGAFGRGTAYLGVATGIAGFGFYLPDIGLLISVVVVLLIGVWNALVARALFRLAGSARLSDGREGHAR
jgi:hypothetical protein